MKIKLQTIALIIMLCLPTLTLKAQTILFFEDFESSPVTSIVNTFGGDTMLIEGGSPCSKASRGNASIFNSANVDFDSLQNATYFMGVNPESPCGGFYNATLISDTLDFSNQDSLKFRCRYFKSTTLGWGGAFLQVVFDNGTTSFTVVDSIFSTTDNWDSLEVTLPSSMIDSSVTIIFDNIGGGEGVGMDDIEVVGYNTALSIDQYAYDSNITIFPVPADDLLHIESADVHSNMDITIIDLYGRVVARESVRQTDQAFVNIEHLSSGVYTVRITDTKDKPAFYKIVKN